MPEQSRTKQEVLIVTGLSGAGRSTVGNALEDLDWYVVDNLPPQMLRPLVELADKAGANLPKIAAVVDVRGRDFFENLQEIIQSMPVDTVVRVLFLDATDASLVRRFESVRRPHPLQGDGTILEGILAERSRMTALRESSDIVVDTSDLNIHQLSTLITEQFAQEDTAGVRLNLMSFGFKYGTPTDADLIADGRFLPNPFWIPELRGSTGMDKAVSDYVLGQPGAMEFVENYAKALEPVLAGYQRENKRHATIAIGCTGGKHRSVALTEELAKRLAELPGVVVRVKHRDFGRE
ncbi:UPF0042 nucleotide-binding protein [Aurantimicrobium minutum]|uniref:RNase adapter RapZ n=1 Tax=Aurantimicrobium minutum TaxID=708131 RepID=UPI0024742A95|nr:RNase adapter RapZ [Aurantimicrobium minutum]MDH6278002.1 UPF0042 nucleotide-binding protein [Aurantimicrobium minutum]